MNTVADSEKPLVELRNISRQFGRTHALIDASGQIWPGRVMCLLGDNGAGKSTLVRMLSGVVQPSGGEMLIDGESCVLSSPRDARSRGFATLYQEVGTVPLMSVARNFVLGQEPVKGWGPFRRLDLGEAGRVALDEIRKLGVTRVTDPERLVGTLSGGERQALAIARAQYFGARLLVLDEPTSALGVKEARFVLQLIRRAAASGTAVVVVTHNAQHALSVGDDFLVLIHGKVGDAFRRGDRTRDELLNLMAGGQSYEELEIEIESIDDP
jgi:simple sugar transport system ATP-binding protein